MGWSEPGDGVGVSVGLGSGDVDTVCTVVVHGGANVVGDWTVRCEGQALGWVVQGDDPGSEGM